MSDQQLIRLFIEIISIEIKFAYFLNRFIIDFIRGKIVLLKSNALRPPKKYDFSSNFPSCLSFIADTSTCGVVVTTLDSQAGRPGFKP